MLTYCINTAVSYILIDCIGFFSTAAILRFDSDSKEELNVWASLVENLLAMRETWVWSLGWENPLGGKYGNPLQYSCLENPHGQRNLVDYIQPMGSQRVGLDWVAKYSAIVFKEFFSTAIKPKCNRKSYKCFRDLMICNVIIHLKAHRHDISLGNNYIDSDTMEVQLNAGYIFIIPL